MLFDVGPQVGAERYLDDLNIAQVGWDCADHENFWQAVDNSGHNAVIHQAGTAALAHNVLGANDALLDAAVGQDGLAGGVANRPDAGH